MECFLTFAMLVIVVTLLVVMSSRRRGIVSQRDLLFEQIAQRFHGACRRGGWFGLPSVRFRYGPTMVLLEMDTARRGERRTVTSVHFRWSSSSPRLELTSPELSALRDERLKPITLGAADFDRRFELRGYDAQSVRKFMSAGVQWHVERLWRLSDQSPLSLTVAQGYLSVRKYERFGSFHDLEEFVRAALELFDQAQLTQSEGIEFVDDGTAQVVQQAVCQVCGEEIVEDLVYCRRCKTPHHLECWQYCGSCSTYGCREQRYAVPAEAQRAESGQRHSEQAQGGQPD